MKIDKGVEIPRMMASVTYPFKEMEVGDSFFIETDWRSAKQSSVLGSLRNYNRKNEQKIKITTRKVEEDGKKGVRVWRIE